MLQRHHLLEITEEGRKAAFGRIAHKLSEDIYDLVKRIVIGNADEIKIPGIVRRREEYYNSSFVPVGFSSPFRLEGSRLRIAADISASAVLTVMSPYEVAEKQFILRTACLDAFAEIYRRATAWNIKLGIWGSAALEIYTGLPYTYDNSDLDLIVNILEGEKVRDFVFEVIKIGQAYGCKVDIEIELPSGYGIQAKELFSPTSTLLAKGLHDVILLPQKDVLDLLK